MRRHRFSIVILILLAVVLILPPSTRAHQHRDEDTAPRITGFVGLPWGTLEEAVIDRYGHPRFETLVQQIPDLKLAARPTWSRGGKRMIYLDHPAYDTAVTTALYVHPSDGLFRGAVQFDPPAPDRCLETYRRVKRRVEQQFPDIDPRESGENPPDFRSFCGAVRSGDAFRVADWKDPGSPAFVRVTLKKNAGAVRLEFFSPMWVKHLKTIRRFRILNILHRQGRSLDALQNRNRR